MTSLAAATDLAHEGWLHDERALLGHLMLGIEHMQEVVQVLPPEGAFIDPRHTKVYELISSLYRNARPHDVESIAECLPHCGDLAETLGTAGLYAMIMAADSCPSNRALPLALTIMERVTSGTTPPAAVQPVAASPSTHLAVSVPAGILVFHVGDNQVPQCVARGTSGRCRFGLYPDQWDYWVVEGYGAVSAADGCDPTPDIFVRQRCEKHLDDPRPDVVAPEWEWFNPQRFPGLVFPHDRMWTPNGLMMPPRRVPEPAKPRPAAPLSVAVPAQPEVSVPTILYWHYDADGVLLYIGITGDFAGRGKAHARGSSWVQFARTSKSVWYPSRAEAEAAEVEAIEAERPLFNHVHNDSPEARERLVRYLIDRGRADLLAPAVSRG